MKVPYKVIRKRIQTIWPKCRNVWLLDPAYEYPTLDEIKAVISNDNTDLLISHGDRFKCNHFALVLSAAVSIHRANSVKGDEPGPWPFGQVLVRKHRGKVEKHSLNICALEDEIVLIEPQDDYIWIASPVDDDPFFVKIP